MILRRLPSKATVIVAYALPLGPVASNIAGSSADRPQPPRRMPLSPYLLSFLLYAVPANIIAAIVVLIGRRRQVQWLASEYPFVYLPWLAFLALAVLVFGGLESLPGKPNFMQTIVVLQSFAAGIMGGTVLLPRLLFPTASRRRILTITGASACAHAVLYVQLRVFLFLVLENMAAHAPTTA